MRRFAQTLATIWIQRPYFAINSLIERKSQARITILHLFRWHMKSISGWWFRKCDVNEMVFVLWDWGNFHGPGPCGMIFSIKKRGNKNNGLILVWMNIIGINGIYWQIRVAQVIHWKGKRITMEMQERDDNGY